jgi:hypothetical protein
MLAKLKGEIKKKPSGLVLKWLKATRNPFYCNRPLAFFSSLKNRNGSRSLIAYN